MRRFAVAIALGALGLLGLASATYVATHPDTARLLRGVVIGGLPPLCAAAFVVAFELLAIRARAPR